MTAARRSPISFFALWASSGLLACSESAPSAGETADGSSPTVQSSDSGTPLLDAGTPLLDAGTPLLDAGTPLLDAGTPLLDAGTPFLDADAPFLDSSAPPSDSGLPVPPEASDCAPTSEDFDQDGFTIAQGDCNDCDANSNPGALDIQANGVDEDCSGRPDDADANCEALIMDLADTDPFSAAAAMDLCRHTTEESAAWGIIDAKYTFADGSPRTLDGTTDLNSGLLTNFGLNVAPRLGKRMLALSSGTARAKNDAGWALPDGHTNGTAVLPPAGFPLPSPSCPDVDRDTDMAFDSVALELRLRVPTNAKSLAFNLNFYTMEYPDFVCHHFSDSLAVIQDPAPHNAVSGNISFDSEGNPIGVNSGLLRVCEPQTAGGMDFDCPRGTAELEETGYDALSQGTSARGGGAATGWLQTSSPVTPGSIVTLRFMVWDVGDWALDSLALVDNFRFSPDSVDGATTQPAPSNSAASDVNQAMRADGSLR